MIRSPNGSLHLLANAGVFGNEFTVQRLYDGGGLEFGEREMLRDGSAQLTGGGRSNLETSGGPESNEMTGGGRLPSDMFWICPTSPLVKSGCC